jgi:outer membrane biosynthesis protein TonB
MTMRRLLPHLLALALGVGAALLVACGGSTKDGIPSASAGDLKSQIQDVQQAVDGGRCDEVSGQLRQVDDGIDELPATVDERLRQALRDAADKLRTSAVAECNEPEETETVTEPEPVETQTETVPPETQTAPPETTTTPPETTTTPPETTPAPVPPAEPPPPVVTPPPPPQGTPGGGARPETGNDTLQAPG